MLALAVERNTLVSIAPFTQVLALKIQWIQWPIYIVKFWTPPSPLGPIFMQFSVKFGHMIGWRPPLGNPESATEALE